MLNRLYFTIIVLAVCVAALRGTPNAQEDERTIRKLVAEAINRMNKGDLTIFRELWSEDADYVSVDGQLLKGRAQIQEFFRQMAGQGASQPQQRAKVEQIRFITPELATVDGAWTVTGARDANGNELAPIEGRGFELVQKKNGRWSFIATREMIVYKAH